MPGWLRDSLFHPLSTRDRCSSKLLCTLPTLPTRSSSLPHHLSVGSCPATALIPPFTSSGTQGPSSLPFPLLAALCARVPYPLDTSWAGRGPLHSQQIPTAPKTRGSGLSPESSLLGSSRV